jgi:hypothetical protein
MLIGYFNSTQDPERDRPSKHVSVEEARQLRKAGTHYAVNHGRDIAEVPAHVRKSQSAREETVKPVSAGCLRVVGQTAKAGIKHKPTRMGPGRPRLAFS